MTFLQSSDIASLKHGNNTAFEKLYKAYYNKLFFFSIQYLTENCEAENVVQETFMAFWLNKESFAGENETSIKAWLYNTIKNKCLNHLEKESNKLKYLNYKKDKLQLNIASLENMEISEVTFNEVKTLLLEALDTMPAQCRKVFELSRFQGFKNKEIADQLSISVKAVEGHITRALKLLKHHLHDYLSVCVFLNLF